MTCPTPSIDVDKFKVARRRRTVHSPVPHSGSLKNDRTRREVVTVNDELHIVVEISFVFDGVTAYRNLTNTPLEKYSRLTVYANPIIEMFNPPTNTQTFIPTWPIKDRILEIKVGKINIDRMLGTGH